MRAAIGVTTDFIKEWFDFLMNLATNVEPATVAGAISAISALLVGWRTGHLDIGVVYAALTAVSTLYVRGKVWCQESHQQALADAEHKGLILGASPAAGNEG